MFNKFDSFVQIIGEIVIAIAAMLIGIFVGACILMIFLAVVIGPIAVFSYAIIEVAKIISEAM